MHAVLITFRSSAAPATLTGLFARHAEALQGVPGLVMKTWLDDGATLGGFHLFATRQAAAEYLASDLVAELVGHPEITVSATRHFAVMEALSRATGTPQPLGA